jgi:hypothetical protein
MSLEVWMSYRRFKAQQLTVAVLVTCLLCTACTTTRSVTVSSTPSASKLSSESGGKAVIVLRNGEQLAGTIVGADEKSLTVRTASGSLRSVAFEDLQSMQTRRMSGGRTAAAIGAAILLVGGAFIAALHHQALHDE